MQAKPSFPKFPRRIKHTFEWREDQHGNTGWILAGMDDFDVGDGMTVAHDVLEHFEHADGDASSEFQAFGCMVWGRIGGDYWGSFNYSAGLMSTDPARGMGSELGMFYVRLGGIHAAPPWAYMPLEDDEAEEFIATMRPIIAQGIQDEGDSMSTDEYRDLLHLDEDHTGEEEAQALDSAAADVCAWVRYGFTRATQSWGVKRNEWNSSQEFYFSNLFYSLETVLNDQFAHGDTGDALIIEVDRHDYTAKVTRAYADDYGRYVKLRGEENRAEVR